MPNTITDNGGDGGGGIVRPPRLPRWTRQEILVLIQGKKVAESRGRGRSGARIQNMDSSDGSGPSMVMSPVEPKWASVSSYCRKHGVNRGPVQCRKRWSNLTGDYKKIKEWELKKTGADELESFWVMRNDLRRERKLPGFFDHEVFDILDGRGGGKEVESKVIEEEKEVEGGKDKESLVVEKEDKESSDAVFDSGQTAAEDGLFSESDDDEEDQQVRTVEPSRSTPVAVKPISERKFSSTFLSSFDQDRVTEKQADKNIDRGITSSRDIRKRPRPSVDEVEEEREKEEEPDFQQHLIKILNMHTRMLTKQLEAQNINYQLDRDQRRDQANSMVKVLGKLADAIGRIADKI